MLKIIKVFQKVSYMLKLGKGTISYTDFIVLCHQFFLMLAASCSFLYLSHHFSVLVFKSSAISDLKDQYYGKMVTGPVACHSISDWWNDHNLCPSDIPYELRRG
jgi:hypothetical protein